MFESWFTQKCTAFVNNTGEKLAGDGLVAAENAVKNAEMENLKIWTGNDGFFYVRKRALFASAEVLRDRYGNPVQMCNCKVKSGARFCSKCGAAAPGGGGACSGCGKMLSNDSPVCPHCGKKQDITSRQNLSDGSWLKGEDVFAEFFDLEDVALKMGRGLDVKSGHCCVFLVDGKFVDILAPGVYSDEQLKAMAVPYGSKRHIVMIDKGEFPVRISIEKIHSKDDIETDLLLSLIFRLDELNINLFLQNFMGRGLTGDGQFSNIVVYDEIARKILQFTGLLVREYCSTKTIKELFTGNEGRKALEKYIETELFEHLKPVGMSMMRLNELGFKSEAFEHLREQSAKLEFQRRESEIKDEIQDLENASALKRQEHSFALQENDAAHNQKMEKMAADHEIEISNHKLTSKLRSNEIIAESEIRIRKAGVFADIELETARKDAEREAEEQDLQLKLKRVEKMIQLKNLKDPAAQTCNIQMPSAVEGEERNALLTDSDDPVAGDLFLQVNEQDSRAECFSEEISAKGASREVRTVSVDSELADGDISKDIAGSESWKNDCKCLKVDYDKNVFLMSRTLAALRIKLTPLNENLRDVVILMAQIDHSGRKVLKPVPVEQELKTGRTIIVSIDYNPGDVKGQATLDFYVGCCLDDVVNYYKFSTTQPVFDPDGSREEFRQIIINQSINAQDAADINFYGDMKKNLDTLPGKTVNDMIGSLHQKPACFLQQPLVRINHDPTVKELIEKNGVYPEITNRLLLYWNGYKIFLLADKEISLGRSPEVSVKIRKQGIPEAVRPNSTVSRFHANVYYYEDHVELEDHSSYGCHVNDNFLKHETVELPSSAKIEFGDIHWNMNLQYCSGANGQLMCRTCLKRKVKSLTFSRCDGDKEYYFFVWQCCDLGRVIRDLMGWKVFFRDGTFIIMTPDGERNLLLPGGRYEYNNQAISAGYFVQ